MFFDREQLIFQIIDVVALDQTEVRAHMTGRNFDALSYRFSADTVLKTETQTITAHDGTVLFTPAGVDYSRISAHDKLIAVHIHTENYVSRELEHFSAANRSFFEEKFKALFEHWTQKEVGYKYTCAAMLNEIFKACHLENHHERTDYGIISASVKYLHEHFTAPKLTVGEIASRSFISEVYFRRLFKATFGVSPAKYITEQRIQHAVGLIATGYYSLKEVAYLSGYTDYPYFSEEFKRIKGISPSHYLCEWGEPRHAGKKQGPPSR